MEETKKEILSILSKLKKLDTNKRGYIKGWLDAKLEKKEGAS